MISNFNFNLSKIVHSISYDGHYKKILSTNILIIAKLINEFF